MIIASSYFKLFFAEKSPLCLRKTSPFFPFFGRLDSRLYPIFEKILFLPELKVKYVRHICVFNILFPTCLSFLKNFIGIPSCPSSLLCYTKRYLNSGSLFPIHLMAPNLLPDVEQRQFWKETHDLKSAVQ